LVEANVSERHTVFVFSPEDGDSMFLRNVGLSSLHGAKTQKIIILTAVKI
jgi:hypothetical protein